MVIIQAYCRLGFMRWVLFIGMWFLGIETTLAQNRFVLDERGEWMHLKGSIEDYRQQKISDGFLAFNVDSTYKKSDSLVYEVFRGRQYAWAELNVDAIKTEIISQTSFRKKKFTDQPINPKDYLAFTKSILEVYANNGFPFCRLKLGELKEEKIDSNTYALSAKLKCWEGPLVRIDTIYIKGTAELNRTFLLNYLDLYPGKIFSKKEIEQSSIRIKEIPFLLSTAEPGLMFSEKGAAIFLYIDKKKSNTFNALIGVLPENNTGKIRLSGEATIHLRNALNKGELISLDWQQFPNSSQQLLLATEIPYIFKSSFGFGADFRLFKQDSTYAEFEPGVNVSYIMPGYQKISLSYHRYSSTVINLNQYQNSLVLPPFANTDIHRFGLGFDLNSLDYKLNPRSGFESRATGILGYKEIQKIPELNEDLYSGIQLKSNQLEFTYKAGYFIPLLKRFSFHTEIKGGQKFNEQLLQNELFRVGGSRDLRGFDENSFGLSSYHIGTADFRFLLDRDSHVLLFFDQAYVERKVLDEFSRDTPFAFGIGTQFNTGAGNFILSYALGSQQDNPILLRNGKVHFGFVSIF